MKKSEIYKVAQIAVAETTFKDKDVKLEVLRELMAREDFEKFIEDEAEKKVKVVEAV
jgi:hypothetical protein